VIHFVSDTHWGHKNIIKYSNRPFSSVKEMDEHMIARWNESVKPEDHVWHLGDFSFQTYPDFKNTLRRLNGTINFVYGNHDKMIHQHETELLGSFNAADQKAGSNAWPAKMLNSIQNYAELKMDGEMFVLFHYGQRVWNKSHNNSIHLYGHSHGSLPPFGKSVDVGVDCKEITSEYRPVSMDEVIKYMAKRSAPVVDHHGMKDD